MRQQITSFIGFFVALAVVLYIVALIFAAIGTLKSEPQFMPAFLLQVITVIGGILATNLGAVVGLTVGAPEKLRAHDPEPRYVRAGKHLQIAAAWLYVGALVFALIVWTFTGFRDDNVVICIPEMTKTLLGVVAGALAVAVGASQK